MRDVRRTMRQNLGLINVLNRVLDNLKIILINFSNPELKK